MNIRARITLQFTALVSVALTLFAISIYYFSEHHRHRSFLIRLKENALTNARLFSKDVKEIDSLLLKVIGKNSVNLLPDESIFIYNLSGKLIFTTKEHLPEALDEAKVKKIVQEKEIYFQEEGNDVVGIYFEGKEDQFVVLASAYDKSGLENIRYLKYLLFLGLITAISLNFFVGLWFSKRAMNPLSDVIRQLDQITATHLNLRVKEGNGKDEIAQLAIKFNKMLLRLENSFELQKSFIATASHELRTPLTMLMGNLEVALMNEKMAPSEKDLLLSLLAEIKQLKSLSNGLLDLAQAHLELSEIKLEQLRIDELFGTVKAELERRNEAYHIVFNIHTFPEDEAWFTICANESLMKSALLNILENACKYSMDHTAHVQVMFDENEIQIQIRDTGIGIAENDLKHIFEPFYRAGSVKNYAGSGIGLPLAQKIIQQHKGRIQIHSELHVGTTVKIFISHL